jgi:hypothetical protein
VTAIQGAITGLLTRGMANLKTLQGFSEGFQPLCS